MAWFQEMWTFTQETAVRELDLLLRNFHCVPEPDQRVLLPTKGSALQGLAQAHRLLVLPDIDVEECKKKRHKNRCMRMI